MADRAKKRLHTNLYYSNISSLKDIFKKNSKQENRCASLNEEAIMLF